MVKADISIATCQKCVAMQAQQAELRTCIVLTEVTFQALTSELKAVADWNILCDATEAAL